MRIYVASSWRNEKQRDVVGALRAAGHDVYDFRDSTNAFHWSDVDPAWKKWNTPKFRQALKHPKVVQAHAVDHAHLGWADVGVLVLPCGISAHIEAGYMAGQGKPVFIFSQMKKFDPELMYLTLGPIHSQYDALVKAVCSVIDTGP